MAQEWTDGRLDDLSRRVDHGFASVDQRFDRLETEVHGLRVEMRDEFTAIRGEVSGLQRTMVFGTVSMTGAILAGFAGICALIAASL